MTNREVALWAVIGSLVVLCGLLALAAQHPPARVGVSRPIVPCGTDAECHRLNPGVCPEGEPYCF